MNKVYIIIIVFLLLTTICNANNSQLILFSNFTQTTEDWSCSGGQINHASTTGNPGGYLSVKDTSTNEMRIFAPEKYLGDLSLYNNGLLAFDATIIDNPDGLLPNFGKVTFYNDALKQSVTVDITNENPENSWKTYYISMNANIWYDNKENEWQNFLSNISIISVSLEAGSKVTETMGFDNFKVIPPSDVSVNISDSDYDGIIDLWDKCPDQLWFVNDRYGCPIISGDFDSDGKLSLKDMIMSFQTMSGVVFPISDKTTSISHFNMNQMSDGDICIGKCL